MHKYFIILISITFYCCNTCQAQVSSNIDSIDFYKFYSPTVLLHLPTEKLLNLLGKPDHFSIKRDMPCDYKESKSLSFNILGYKKEDLLYWDYDSIAILHSINIKNYRIYYEDFCFDKNTLIRKVIDYFKVPAERIDTVSGLFVSSKFREKSKYYRINFTYPEICNDEITLYFNSKGYLIEMYFHIFRFNSNP